MSRKPHEHETKIRIDKWLWAARFYKTRSLATDAVSTGKVHVNGQRLKPSRAVHVGDTMHIKQVHREVWITVVELSDKRGNAELAQTLYTLNEEKLFTKDNAYLADMGVAMRDRGAGRPTKRERRKINKFTS